MAPALQSCARRYNMTDWPHSPVHRLDSRGAYIVTAATYQRLPVFTTRARLDMLCRVLLDVAAEFGWNLQAWAIFPNHYHFVAISPEKAASLRPLIQRLHSQTSRHVNQDGDAIGRAVWFEYWETHLTFPASYFARLNYVHRNAVHHRLVQEPTLYPWCSAGWFLNHSDRAFYQRIMKMKSNTVRITDDFEVSLPSV